MIKANLNVLLGKVFTASARCQASTFGSLNHHLPTTMEDQGQTRTIFRGCDKNRVELYLTTNESEHITTDRAGDFHLKEPAAYFTYSHEYAQKLAYRQGRTGRVIKQVIPLDMLTKAADYHNFGAVPDDLWRQLITACRRQEKVSKLCQGIGRSTHV